MAVALGGEVAVREQGVMAGSLEIKLCAFSSSTSLSHSSFVRGVKLGYTERSIVERECCKK